MAHKSRTLKNKKVAEVEDIPTVGSKASVYHGNAKHTSGGLTKKDLMRHKGRIVSRARHAIGLKRIQHLKKLGFTAKKGKFQLFSKKR